MTTTTTAKSGWDFVCPPVPPMSRERFMAEASFDVFCLIGGAS